MHQHASDASDHASASASASATGSASAMFKLCCLLFLLIGDALWGCRTGLAREGAPGAEG
jgi:hypothetical protein